MYPKWTHKLLAGKNTQHNTHSPQVAVHAHTHTRTHMHRQLTIALANASALVPASQKAEPPSRLGLGGKGFHGGLGLGGGGLGLGLGGLDGIGHIGDGDKGERTGSWGARDMELGGTGEGVHGDEGLLDVCVACEIIPPGRHCVASELPTTEAMASAMAVPPPKAMADETAFANREDVICMSGYWHAERLSRVKT